MKKAFLDTLPPLTSSSILELKKTLNSSHPTELGQMMAKRSPKEREVIFLALSPRLAVKTFEYLPLSLQKEMLNNLPSQVKASILNELSPDDRTAFMEELPKEVVNKLLAFLTASERALTEKLLSYPEDSVGRLMTTDYIAIKMDWTVRQVLDYVREHGRDSETIDVLYVVGERGVLIDDIRIREFLFASLDAKVSEITDRKFIALSVYDTEEKAIETFSKYNRVALPVVDEAGILMGVVTSDDILNLSIKRTTEEIQKIGGSEVLDAPYMQLELSDLIKKRASWLILLFFGEMLTASAMAIYEKEISKAVVLALFLPLIISSGGNAGSQASTIIIRSLALSEITLRDVLRVLRRELAAGIAFGIILGTVGFFRVSLWSIFSDIYGAHWLLIALTIFTSLIGVVLWGTLSGAMLPFLLKSLGFDPASSSAPLVATIVDVTGLIIYFSIAMVILRGTLL